MVALHSLLMLQNVGCALLHVSEKISHLVQIFVYLANRVDLLNVLRSSVQKVFGFFLDFILGFGVIRFLFVDASGCQDVVHGQFLFELSDFLFITPYQQFLVLGLVDDRNVGYFHHASCKSES